MFYVSAMLNCCAINRLLEIWQGSVSCKQPADFLTDRHERVEDDVRVYFVRDIRVSHTLQIHLVRMALREGPVSMSSHVLPSTLTNAGK